MKEWYKKPIYIVTNKNVLSVISLLFAIQFYILERFAGNDKRISICLFIFAIGQRVGSRFTNEKQRNKVLIPLLIIGMISYFIVEITGIGKDIVSFWFALIIGGQVGFLAEKAQKEMKNKQLII